MRCERPPTHVRIWPGKEPDLVCAAHANDTQNVGLVLEITIPCYPIITAIDPTDHCASSEGRRIAVRAT